ncbi:hypothetical protein QNI19_11630 [Cytophagaceae bacterium DM2B3-1]|uniref:Uncharacterized protein n=1 Tax=Xanthocytophaga flava TaxID=3048013 RepID=A0ABT7CLN7_9BACT|nr:hypothetical protein [Xanthocytophaga flavus]MDJ1469639.1 hypothetical protein [Xanthocytophaga flavus]MDJ1493584.1 hypothetical protein [Xanthocytophaga flavus]
MPRYHTNSTAIRKFRSEYYRLRAYKARLNEQLHHMLKRIKQIEEDEKLSLAKHILLTKLLAHADQQKAELEAQAVSKQRDKQLKKAEKELKELRVQYKRNDLHLVVLDRKKDKDNMANYILKEAKRDQVTVRIQSAYTSWKKLEQLQAEEQQSQAVYEAQVIELVKASLSEPQTVDNLTIQRLSDTFVITASNTLHLVSYNTLQVLSGDAKVWLFCPGQIAAA